MSDVIMPTDHVVERSLLPSFEQYQDMHKLSLENPGLFWTELINEFHWKHLPNPNNFMSYNFNINEGKIFVKFMEGSITNVCFNVVDKHVRNGYGDKIAFHWQGNHPEDSNSITYAKLMIMVCRFSNGLRERNIGKGDRVAIYMPMILETVVCMLACARIGAVHSVVFAGFSSDALAERMSDCKAKVLVTADGAWRGNKLLNLKSTCDDALEKAKTKFNHTVQMCIVVPHLERATPCGRIAANLRDMMYKWNDDMDLWWHQLVDGQSIMCNPEWMEAEDPLFILYTSGSTGKPKGVLHTTAGYMLYAAATYRYVFDQREKDVYMCTADVGWITGHTYVVYGPLANAATSVMFEGTPFYPDNDRYWSVVEKYKVTQFYTAPTAIRSLMRHGNQNVTRHNVSSLRVLASVGEPINSEAWMWYYNVVGSGRCSIADTYWQTETGGHIITGIPAATPMKPGSAGFPFFGVEPVLLNDDGTVIDGEGEGYLAFPRPWPGIMRTLFEDHERYEDVYFKRFPGYYCTGDGAKRDADGFLWITGRMDDMLNVSGHLMSTSEVEGVLTEELRVSEAAVVAKPHPLKGQCLYCFVTLTEGASFNDDLVSSLKLRVRHRIGAFAAPDVIQHAPALPKTRSGKIMRRILRRIALGETDLGDTSTLADPSVVEELLKNRPT